MSDQQIASGAQFAPTFSLQGRTALVTGASRGIGWAAAALLHRRGARVALVGRSTAQLEQLAKVLGDGAVPATLDVTDRVAVDRLLPLLAAQLGGSIDIVVNNAGLIASTPLESVDDSQWEAVLQTNLTAPMYVARAALPYLRAGGSIINISSVLGKFGAPQRGAYCAAKHGIIGWTRALALELAPRGVRVNAICPGWVDTEMAAQNLADMAQQQGLTPAAMRALAESAVPQKRFLAPEEVAELVAFLASPAAAGITGEALSLSAGTTPHA